MDPTTFRDTSQNLLLLSSPSRRRSRASLDDNGYNEGDSPSCPGTPQDVVEVEVEVEVLPWYLAAAFLTLPEVLSLRLTSQSIAMSLQEGLGVELCSAWLEQELQSRNVYIMNNVHQWTQAKQQQQQQLFDAESCLLEWLMSSWDDDDKIPTPAATLQPFDRLLYSLRVLHCLPTRLTVAYSGKHGRHCWGLRSNTAGNNQESPLVVYPKCHRGKKRNCPTCRTKIATVPILQEDLATSTATTDGSTLPTIDDSLRIPVTTTTTTTTADDKVEPSSRRLVLDRYHNKCIPNLPSNLVCPCCRVTDRRTLMLTEFSYPTERGTERRSAERMSLTFTPSPNIVAAATATATTTTSSSASSTTGSRLETTTFVSQPEAKRRRLHSDDDETNDDNNNNNTVILPFPPLYQEAFFLPGFDQGDAVSNVKRGIAIHCDACGKFGLLAPALLKNTIAPNNNNKDDDGTLSLEGRFGGNLLVSAALLTRKGRTT